ncbi:MAG: hypothetical protein WBZ01_02260 [Terriglobales bacterium]
MYIIRGAAGFDVANLRQGDILEGIPFPLIDHSTLQVLGAIKLDRDFNALPEIAAKTHKQRQDAEWLTALVPVRFGFCIVLSNCCDLEPRDGTISAPVFNLARLHPIPENLRNNPDLFDSLKANKDPRHPTDPGYIDFFYLEPHALLQGRDWRVHYNQVTTLPTGTIATFLLRKKVLQLDDRARMKFKIKLGFTLMRINDEERKLGLENPWQETAGTGATDPNPQRPQSPK